LNGLGGIFINNPGSGTVALGSSISTGRWVEGGDGDTLILSSIIRSLTGVSPVEGESDGNRDVARNGSNGASVIGSIAVI